MLTQSSVHSKVSPASPEPDGLNYNFTYQYNGPRPHAATRIGNWAYLYDANGNVIEQQWIGDQGEGHGNDWGGDNHGGRESMNLAPAALTTNAPAAANDQNGPGNGERDAHGNFRYGDHRYGGEHGNDWGMQNPHYGQGGGPKDQTFVWDEENRLIHTYGFGGPTDYLYDYNGERALKRGEHGEIWYIDKYYQVQNGHQIEKHIFVGDTRVVTRLEDGDGFDSGYEEHNIFYYHPDHLGSTTFVTTQEGHEWEHMEYTPYGQQWIDEGTDKSVIAYRFTSKEYDSEMGLYYYGARYLDPVTARWMTPDPGFKEYLPATPTSDQVRQQNANLAGGGGVFNFINLAPYAYGNNNPIRYVDPTGAQNEEEPEDLYSIASKFMMPEGGGGGGGGGYSGPPPAEASAVEREMAGMEPAAPEGAETAASKSAAVSGTEATGILRNPATIRFSQSSVSSRFRGGGSVEDLITGLKNGSIKPNNVSPIRLVEKDGQMFALDNRRLYAFQQAGVPVPTRMATPEEIAKEAWKFTTTNGGTSVTLRGQ